MTITESVRLSILELKHRGMSVREIAAETGISKNTVSKVIKEGAELSAVPKIDVSQRARATKELSQKSGTKIGTKIGTADCPKKGAVVEVISPTTITRDLTIGELYSLLFEAKDTLARAKQGDEDGPDLNAEIAAINAIRQILTQMGKWCGLDDSNKVVDVRADKPPDQYTLDEALRLAEDLCRRRGSSVRGSPSRSGRWWRSGTPSTATSSTSSSSPATDGRRARTSV